MEWQYFKPKFQYEKVFPDLIWGWAGHKYFIYDFIRNIKPKIIVELGTHNGTSFFSMCQAVKDEKLPTKLTAIDTWKGDRHSGFYDNSIFNNVNKIKSTYYRKLKIRLLRKTFNQAVANFKDKTIDILHIDGLHIYEAVKNDYNNWFPKVKDDGFIILHDICEKTKDFGVYILWEELKKKFGTLQFYHSSGFGILFKNRSSYLSLKKISNDWPSYYLQIYENKLIAHIRKIEGLNIFYKQSLDTITSSKTYKIWQRYCQLRKTLLGKKS